MANWLNKYYFSENSAMFLGLPDIANFKIKYLMNRVFLPNI